MTRPSAGAIRQWVIRWRPVLPLMAAELILWLGFAAFLPVLPLYLTGRGVDIPTLGVVVAAWPAARLIFEPFFGWLADRTRRVPLMVIGLLLSAVFAAAPLAVSGFAAFFVLRALAGVAAAMYDPAARGYVLDATPADRRGEAFGLYGAAQMAGFLLGPALGAMAAAITGRTEAVFVLGGVSVAIAGVVVAVAVPERPHVERVPSVPPEGFAELQREVALPVERPSGPASLVNRFLIAAIVLNFGAFFAGGTWEVIWSLYMQARGATIEFIGFTFALFSLPVLFVSPWVGRRVDRRGPLLFIVIGSVLATATGVAYTLAYDLAVIAVIVLLEALGWSLVNPALYSIVGAGSPPGRSSTAQGVFGAAGTLAYIVSSLFAGRLFATDLAYPFFLLSAVVFGCLVLALAIVGPARLQGPADEQALRAVAETAP